MYLASTSVETLPGTFLRISSPKLTNSLSMVFATCSSSDLNGDRDKKADHLHVSVTMTSQKTNQHFFKLFNFRTHYTMAEKSTLVKS